MTKVPTVLLQKIQRSLLTYSKPDILGHENGYAITMTKNLKIQAGTLDADDFVVNSQLSPIFFVYYPYATKHHATGTDWKLPVLT